MDDPEAIVAEQVRRAFVGSFGAAEFEVWLGKDGSARHSAAEVGNGAADALVTLLAIPEVRAHVARLHEAGVLAPPLLDAGPPS